MPTKILYWEAYFKPHGGLSFFGEYNPFAVRGSSVHNGMIGNENAEMLFLSRPDVWAQYVVAGIKAKYPEMAKTDKQLRAVGQFLFDAGLFGFSLDALAASHIEGIGHYYTSAEKLLREDERTVDISTETANHILGMYSVKSRATIIPTGYGKKEKFVRNTLKGKMNFWKTVNRVLEKDEIKRYLAEDRVLTAWTRLRDGTVPSLHNNIAKEHNPPEEQYPLPSVDLFTYADEEIGRRAEERRKRQIEAERQMHIQSDLGRMICELIGEVPPKKERQGVLDRLEEIVSQYTTVIERNCPDHAMATELDEIIRRIEELGQNVNNAYTRELRGMFRPLKRLVKA